MKKVAIEESWASLMNDEFEKDYFVKIRTFLSSEYTNKTIFPHPTLIFNAFNLTPVSNVKVVIIGQDPYHGPGQAHGLCFSVNDDINHPPSLVNIFKEMKEDVGGDIPKSGNLERWSKQGILLLNSTLTVESGKPNSHKRIGWDIFTDSVIKRISKTKDFIVFVLWGAFAHKKEILIDTPKHCIIKSVHPSPLSAYNGFFGSKPFSKVNKLLKSKGHEPILW